MTREGTIVFCLWSKKRILKKKKSFFHFMKYINTQSDTVYPLSFRLAAIVKLKLYFMFNSNVNKFLLHLLFFSLDKAEFNDCQILSSYKSSSDLKSPICHMFLEKKDNSDRKI